MPLLPARADFGGSPGLVPAQVWESSEAPHAAPRFPAVLLWGASRWSLLGCFNSGDPLLCCWKGLPCDLCQEARPSSPSGVTQTCQPETGRDVRVVYWSAWGRQGRDLDLGEGWGYQDS